MSIPGGMAHMAVLMPSCDWAAGFDMPALALAATAGAAASVRAQANAAVLFVGMDLLVSIEKRCP